MSEASVTELWTGITNWLEGNAPELLETLQHGASEKEILKLEAKLGTPLPADYKVFLAICNGQSESAEYGFFSGELLSVQHVRQQWDIWRKLNEAGQLEGLKTKPDKGVQKGWWNPKWVPFTHDGGGNNLCLDLEPARGGTVGQVITMWHDSEYRSVQHATFSAWLAQVLAGLESGEIVFDREDYNALVDASDLE